MSFLSDVLAFEKFNLGDMWDKVKENPEQLLLGAADPFGAKLWGSVLGEDFDPIVNQMGGAMGGGPLGLGGGGVYDRAQAAGIDTGPGQSMHDLAELIAASYAGGYGASKIPGLSRASNARTLGNALQSYGQQQPQPTQTPPVPYVAQRAPLETGDKRRLLAELLRVS